MEKNAERRKRNIGMLRTALISLITFAVNISAGTVLAEFDFNTCKQEARNTLMSNDCFKQEEDRLFDINTGYFNRIIELHQNNLLVTDRLKEARTAFIEKKDSYCSAQYEIWVEGSIRNIMYLECSHFLIKQDSAFLQDTYLNDG